MYVCCGVFSMQIPTEETPVWLNKVTCSGNETKLSDCSLGEWGGHGKNCTSKGVGLICYSDPAQTDYGKNNFKEYKRPFKCQISLFEQNTICIFAVSQFIDLQCIL